MSDKVTILLAARDDLDLVKVWILRDKLLYFEFQNKVIDAMIEHVNIEVEEGKYVNLWSLAFHYAFDNTLKEAPILRLFGDMYCLVGQGDFTLL